MHILNLTPACLHSLELLKLKSVNEIMGSGLLHKDAYLRVMSMLLLTKEAASRNGCGMHWHLLTRVTLPSCAISLTMLQVALVALQNDLSRLLCSNLCQMQKAEGQPPPSRQMTVDDAFLRSNSLSSHRTTSRQDSMSAVVYQDTHGTRRAPPAVETKPGTQDHDRSTQELMHAVYTHLSGCSRYRHVNTVCARVSPLHQPIS